jgi:hypothetical protein
MKHWLLAGLLFAQSPEVDLHEELLRTRPSSARGSIYTIVATHVDGTAARGEIMCDGPWFKYADEDTVLQGDRLPFTTDARGAAIFNPPFDYVGEPMTCTAVDRDLHTGSVTFEVSDSATVHRIIVR